MRFKALVGIHYLNDVVEAVHKVLIVFQGVVSSAAIRMFVHATAHDHASTSTKLDALQGKPAMTKYSHYAETVQLMKHGHPHAMVSMVAQVDH